MIVTPGTLAEATLMDVIEVLVSAIDVRNCSFGHSIRVAVYAVQIAEATGCQKQVLEQIRLGALLHDIGQIYWPEEITKKQGIPLTERNEKSLSLTHTREEILLRIGLLLALLNLTFSTIKNGSMAAAIHLD